MDHYTFLGNCPPTPPLGASWAFSQRRMMTQIEKIIVKNKTAGGL